MAVSVASGREVFAANCVVCHGEQGRGSQQLGAPNQTDQSWVYGGDIGAIYQTIYEGRQGEMPAWEHRLSPVESKIRNLFLPDKGSEPCGCPDRAAFFARSPGWRWRWRC